MKIRFRDIPDSPNGDAAIGTLKIPEEISLDDCIGMRLEYEITKTRSDFPYSETINKGVLSKIESIEFYEFEIIKVISRNKYGSQGILIILCKYSNE